MSYYRGNVYIIHSAKGSTWKNHKYIKKIGDVYYYTKEQLAKAGKAISDTSIYEHKVTATVGATSGGRMYQKHVVLTNEKVTVGDVTNKAKKSISNAIKKVGNTKLYEHEVSYARKDGTKKVLEKKSVTIGGLANKAKKSVSSAIKKVSGIVIGSKKRKGK